MPILHRILLVVLLVGNALAFAGVDPVTRLVTALLVLVLVVDLRKTPAVPKLHLWSAALLFLAAVLQLLPLPEGLRRLLQPGFAEVMAGGWAPLSLAPWATVQVMASVIVAVGIALVAERMARTRSGLPGLLGLLAVTGALLAVLGLAGEAGAPEKVLLVRANTGGGGVYGPFVNPNHFAQAIELTLPAAMVLLAVSLRQLSGHTSSRQRAAVTSLAAAVACTISVAAMLRCGSRGGVLFLLAAAATTVPMWWRPRRARRWPWLAVAAVVLVVAVMLASTTLPAVQEGFSQLLVVEGVEGNTRWDLWRGTWDCWLRSPILGSGLGSYRHVIGLDKPATGTAVLQQAHNDWLEWLATSGIVGFASLVLFIIGLAVALRPGRARRLRFEIRYPLAGAALALVATAVHELVGFGLQTPLNRYLLAAWIGLAWGLTVGRDRADREGA
jgi:O-antigen ligase